ncbi:MAG: aminotransferase class I/II-fold pyridoxal phosphate-dependent enzyme [Burkholderiales bacterium]
MNSGEHPKKSSAFKDALILQSRQQRLHRASSPPTIDRADTAEAASPLARSCDFSNHPGYTQVQLTQSLALTQGVTNPYFRVHDRAAGATTSIDGRSFINFSSYNYLGLSGDLEVSKAAKEAIDLYGTSVSASRAVSGERPIHQQLERAIASAYEVDDALVFVSGHATNVTTIGYLFGKSDLILHDEYVHNSALQGIQLSGATRMSFPHNDWRALEHLLRQHRRQFQRTLVVVEGIYSMDGDFPDLPKFVEVKNKHQALLMVDEAHSFGILGTAGLGIREHFGLNGLDVDIWMGTLSKALASCGGYIAGAHPLIENLRYLAPGFLYSVGMPPPVAAAALAALEKLRAEPWRVRDLVARGGQFLREAQAAGVNTGTSAGLSIVPAITGSSVQAAKLSAALYESGINVQPILHPAVPEKSARLRFFLSCQHTPDQISETVEALSRYSRHP